MDNSRNNMMRESASIVVDAVDSILDKKIWRTRFRIKEMILQGNPYLKHNICLSNPQFFLFILLNMSFSGSVTTLTGKQVRETLETFEESDTEPVLYDDLIALPGEEKYTAFVERIYQHGLSMGENYDAIKESLVQDSRTKQTRILLEMQSQGLITSTIFYKFPHGSSQGKMESLPQLPAYI